MKYILVYIVFSFTSETLTTGTAEFDSESACEAAEERMDRKRRVNNIPYRIGIHTSCIPKGDEVK